MGSRRFGTLSLFSVLLSMTRIVAFGAQGANLRQPFAVVQPLADHTKLELAPEGLNVLRSISGPVAPVVVIGPYRSGKSFTLNQLLDVGCDEGFGVGHTRATQTKGVWMWGEPLRLAKGGAAEDGGGSGSNKDGSNEERINVLFFDTEGFESAGKADSYDDRIFALSTLMSSVLIYNLPEAIRESDLEKLSFATELATAFFENATSGGEAALFQEIQENEDGNKKKKEGVDGDIHGAAAAAAAAARRRLFERSRTGDAVSRALMVWLIQRDFLQGDSLQASLKSALSQRPNPHNDHGISQLNRIRLGLKQVAANSTAIGLPQPHLDRTRLCEIPDSELDPKYRVARHRLRDAVLSAALSFPKAMQGRLLDGAGLADLITRVVTALNERDIPTGGSLVEYFNRDQVNACRVEYARLLERQTLPVELTALSAVADAAATTVRAKFARERFGAAVPELVATLEAALRKEYKSRVTLNTYESARACEAAELECETVLETEAAQRLPSTGRFQAAYERCLAEFRKKCVGPALAHNADRLQRAWDRENGRFARDYNDKLLNGLIIVSLCFICLFRFVVRWTVGESVAFGGFLFLQIWPRTYLGSGSNFFETSGWKNVVRAWEAVVDNPIVNVERYGIPLLVFIGVLYLTRRRWAGKLRGRWFGARRRRKSKALPQRDLDV